MKSKGRIEALRVLRDLRGRFPLLGATLLAACGTLATAPVTPERGFDVLITNARVIDGTGNPWYRGEVGVSGDRITYVGPSLRSRSAKRVIDAHEMVVSPGFIDMLGHSELTILRTPHAESKITQGITSEITGEVSSAWPYSRPGKLEVDPDKPWKSLGQYFDYIEKKGIAINLGTYVGAESIREALLGDASRNPTPAELAQMEVLVDSAMKDGAVGLGTGLEYPPSSFFTTEELVALTKIAATYGGGYASHIRNENTLLLDAIREAIRIGTASGTWVEIRHLKSRSFPQMQQAVALIDSARRAGIDVTADQYPYLASQTGLDYILPTWVQQGGDDSTFARLRDPSVRARIKAEMRDSTRKLRSLSDAMVDRVYTDSLRVYQGVRLVDIGKMRNEDPLDAAFDIILADKARTDAVYFSFDPEALKLVMQQPWTMVGQDAGARAPDSIGRGHPRAYGTFPRILGEYVRQEGVIPLEFAIRKMTSLPAQRVGLTDRGLLRPGMFADITVFDPATVVDRATFELPQQYATGIKYVMVNGQLVIDDGKITAALPGRALRGPARKR